jgi:hypothetical protein
MTKSVDKRAHKPYSNWKNDKTIPCNCIKCHKRLSIMAQTLKRHMKRCQTIENPKKDDREELWKLLFPNKPVPQPKAGAAKRNLGILNRAIKEEIEDEELEDLLRSSRST